MQPTVLRFYVAPYSSELMKEIERCAERGRQLHPEIESCRVEIERRDFDQQPPRPFHARVEYRLCGSKGNHHPSALQR